MNNVPTKIKKGWMNEAFDPNIKPRVCLRADEGNCAGRLTKEHAIIFAGKQVQEEWAILDICAFHHGVDEYQDNGQKDNEKHTYLALCRATDDELRRISKAIDYLALRSRLQAKYAK